MVGEEISATNGIEFGELLKERSFLFVESSLLPNYTGLIDNGVSRVSLTYASGDIASGDIFVDFNSIFLLLDLSFPSESEVIKSPCPVLAIPNWVLPGA